MGTMAETTPNIHLLLALLGTPPPHRTMRNVNLMKSPHRLMRTQIGAMATVTRTINHWETKIQVCTWDCNTTGMTGSLPLPTLHGMTHLNTYTKKRAEEGKSAIYLYFYLLHHKSHQ